MSSGTESKRRWRANAKNAERERNRDRLRTNKQTPHRERETEEGRLAEAIRDTIRHIDQRL